MSSLEADYLNKRRAVNITTSKTRPDNTTAYTAGDIVCSDDWVFNGLRKVEALYLMAVIFRVDVASLPSGMSTFKLHLYNAATAVQLADNAPQTYLTADKAKMLASITLDAPVDKGDFLWSRTDSINKVLTMAAGGILYGRLETDGAYTPTASAVKTITLVGIGV